MSFTSRTSWALALLLAGPLLTGCASMRAKSLALEESNSERQVLYAKNAALSDEVARLQNECDRLAAALDGASQELQNRDASQTLFPDLEAAGISVGRRGGDVVFTIPTSVTFASGKSTLSKGGKEALRTLAKRLRSEFTGEARFHVEGHTDSDPIRKSGFKSNRHLSIERAMAVIEYLVDSAKISDERFVVVGHGAYHPLAPNKSGADKARNRRVELVVRRDQ